MRIREWLHKRANSPRENFSLLLSGFGVFALGLALVTAGQYLMPTGLNAELAALAGLILIGVGIILAAAGYLSLSILRIFSFLDSKDE